MSDGLDLTGIGIEFPLPASRDDEPQLPPPPRRYHRRGPWSPTTCEAEHLDYPAFESGADRAAYALREIGRAALARIDGATADDKLFEHNGVLVSLNDLLQIIEADALTDILAIRDGSSTFL